jgi:hypothetical protein
MERRSGHVWSCSLNSSKMFGTSRWVHLPRLKLLAYLYCLGKAVCIRVDVFTTVRTDIVVFCQEAEALFFPETLLRTIYLTARYPCKPEDHSVRTINFAKDIFAKNCQGCFSLRPCPWQVCRQARHGSLCYMFRFV